MNSFFQTFYFQIVCRSQTPLSRDVKEKISNFCHVAPEQVSDSIDPYSLGTVFIRRLKMSESDVRRQILMYKDGPLTEIITIFLMALDP